MYRRKLVYKQNKKRESLVFFIIACCISVSAPQNNKTTTTIVAHPLQAESIYIYAVSSQVCGKIVLGRTVVGVADASHDNKDDKEYY